MALIILKVWKGQSDDWFFDDQSVQVFSVVGFEVK